MAQPAFKLTDQSGVYAIENKVNGKRYIGSAINIRRRFIEHKSPLRRGIHWNKYLQRAWNMYGEESFDFYPVLFCDKSNLIYFEQRAIDAIDASNPKVGYNLRPKARNNFGMRHSAKSKAKIGDAMRGSKNHNYGKPMPEDTKLKLSKAKIGKYALGNAYHAKAIVDTWNKATYSCIKEAAAKTGLPPASIREWASGIKRSEKYHGRFIFADKKYRPKIEPKGRPIGSKHPLARRVVDTWTGKIFGTIKEAAEENDFDRNIVRDWIVGRRPGGVNKGRFRYAEDVGK
ncbi:MAG: GIY-YIG nuclease family protein [Synergistaceae bacterium]|jgi:group I intron endonuclease|nr:GIY-YIG nuclease family protein [Synergistaceae bacterium]